MAAHAGGDGSFKRPESVLVVVYTRERECLLLERASPRGFWQSVTGSLRAYETPADCAARELYEETGLPPAGLSDEGVYREFTILPAWRARYAPGATTNREHAFRLELESRRPIVLRPEEHAAHEWLPFELAIRKVSSWTNREALERAAAPFGSR